MKVRNNLLLLALLPHPLLASDLINPDVSYTLDGWHNSGGGLKEGGTWLDLLEASLSLDGEALGLHGFSGYLSAQSTNSNSFSGNYVGDLQGVSNIDAEAAVRLYELWLEQQWQQLSLRAGLYDLNSEFDTNDTGAVLLNSAFGIGSDFAQSGNNGPSIFPTPGLAVRLGWQLSDQWLLRAALLEGTPGDPDHPENTTVRIDDGEGTLSVAEVETTPAQWRWLAAGATAAVSGWMAQAAAITAGSTAAWNMAWMMWSGLRAASSLCATAGPMSSSMSSRPPSTPVSASNYSWATCRKGSGHWG